MTTPPHIPRKLELLSPALAQIPRVSQYRFEEGERCMDVNLATRLHASSAQLQSASLSSQPLSRSSGQSLEQRYEKSGHEAEACVDSEGEEQGRNRLESISIEELAEGELDNASEADILRPDVYEDADPLSANEAGDEDYDFPVDTPYHGGIIEGLRALRCGSDEDERAATKGREGKKQRRGVRVFKRSHSQSIGNDTDDEPPDAHGLEHSARRLRRRVRGPGDKSSLEGTPSTDAEWDEFDGVVALGRAPNESDLEDYSTGSVSTDTTEDAMDID